MRVLAHFVSPNYRSILQMTKLWTERQTYFVNNLLHSRGSHLFRIPLATKSQISLKSDHRAEVDDAALAHVEDNVLTDS